MGIISLVFTDHRAVDKVHIQRPRSQSQLFHELFRQETESVANALRHKLQHRVPVGYEDLSVSDPFQRMGIQDLLRFRDEHVVRIVWARYKRIGGQRGDQIFRIAEGMALREYYLYRCIYVRSQKDPPTFANLFVLIQFVLFDTNKSNISQVPIHHFHSVFRRCGHIRDIKDSIVFMDQTECGKGLLQFY